MTSVTLRWAGPADATSGSTYKIERTTDNSSWSTLAATQAATSPYVSVNNTLAGNTDYGATSVVLTSGTSFSNAGYGWIDDALIQWTGKTDNTLTGVTWHSGYGTYAALTAVYEAHESYADTVTISLNAVLYRVTHTDGDGVASAPTYIWYYSPPVPASSDHCVVVVNILTDLGIEAQAGLSVLGYLSSDTQYGDRQGAHLDAQQSASSPATTNAFGLAFFHCWKNSKRSPLSGTDAAYTFVLDSGDTTYRATVTAATIPDRDWVLLRDIGA